MFAATALGGYLQFLQIIGVAKKALNHHPIICIINCFIICIIINITSCITTITIASEPQPRVHESGGKYGNGIISQRYTMGQTIDIEVGTTMMIQI